MDLIKKRNIIFIIISIIKFMININFIIIINCIIINFIILKNTITPTKCPLLAAKVQHFEHICKFFKII